MGLRKVQGGQGKGGMVRLAVIKISRCRDCPLIDRDGAYPICGETEQEIDDVNEVPDWCPHIEEQEDD